MVLGDKPLKKWPSYPWMNASDRHLANSCEGFLVGGCWGFWPSGGSHHLSILQKVTLPETNGKFAPENSISQKEAIIFQPSIFRGELAVSFREGKFELPRRWFHISPRVGPLDLARSPGSASAGGTVPPR